MFDWIKKRTATAETPAGEDTTTSSPPPPSPSRCLEYCCSDWARALATQGDIEIPSRQDLLQNAVHPLFSTDKIVGVNVDHTIQCRSALLRSCRLVTRLMTQDTFVRFVVAIHQGDLYRPEGRSFKSRKGKQIRDVKDIRWGDEAVICPKKSQLKVDDTMRTTAATVVQAMVAMVDIDVGPMLAFPDAEAVCTILKGPLTPEQRASFPHGIRTLITFNEDRVAQLILKDVTDQLTTGSLWNDFFAGECLLHEFGHSLRHAVNGRLLIEEPFYQNSPYRELGFELVAKVFGGIPESTGMAVAKVPHEANMPGPHMLAWPSHVLGRHYRGMGFPSKGKSKIAPFDVIAHLPATDIVRLFRESFWQDMSAEQRDQPLLDWDRPQWVVGCGNLEDGKEAMALCSLNGPVLPLWAQAKLRSIINGKRYDWEGMTEMPGKLALLKEKMRTLVGKRSRA